MRVAAQIALALDLCSKRLVESQNALLEAFELPDRPPRVDPERVLSAIALDKKARRGKVAWVMPRRMGHAEIGHVVPGAVVRRVVTRSLA
jgi:3-dehydroquinate synthase